MIFIVVSLWCVAGGASATDRLGPQDTASFRYMGKTVASLGFSYVTATVDVRTQQRMFRQLADAFSNIRQADRNKTITLPPHRRRLLEAQVIRQQALEAQFRTALEAFGMEDLPGGNLPSRYGPSLGRIRSRRSILGLLWSGAQTLWSYFSHNHLQSLIEGNSDRISSVAIQARRQAVRLDVVSEDVRRIQKNLAALRDHQRAQVHFVAAEQLLALLEEQVGTLLATAADLKRGRINERFLATQALADTFKDLTDRTHRAGLKLLIARPTDILQCEAEFFVDASFIHLVIRVPTAKEDDSLQVFQYRSVPIHLADDLYMSIQAPLDIIAATWEDTREFRAMSLTDLLKCNHIGDWYICEEGNVMRQTTFLEERSDETCLFALFKENIPAIQSTCRFVIQEPPNSITSLGDNQFVGFAASRRQGRITCVSSTGVSTTEPFSINGRYQFALKPGCTADTGSHTVYATSYLTEQRIDHQSWAWDQPLSRSLNISRVTLRDVVQRRRDTFPAEGVTRERLWEWVAHDEGITQLSDAWEALDGTAERIEDIDERLDATDGVVAFAAERTAFTRLLAWTANAAVGALAIGALGAAVVIYRRREQLLQWSLQRMRVLLRSEGLRAPFQLFGRTPAARAEEATDQNVAPAGTV